MFRPYYFALILLLAATVVVQAQQSPPRPNLTGIWNMDKEKSSFGGLDSPQSARYLIRHLGSKLEMQYEYDDRTTRVDIIPDGQERVLETLPDSENMARVYWSGSVLVFEGRIRPMSSSNALPVKWTSRWTLSADKRVLTIDRHLASQQATADQKVIFNKEVTQGKAQ